MKVNISFKYFSQNVSVGYCLILLGMTIAGVYAAVIRPDVRWIIILVVFFTDLFSVFGIGRICRSYDIRTDGVVAIKRVAKTIWKSTSDLVKRGRGITRAFGVDSTVKMTLFQRMSARIFSGRWGRK